MPSIGLLKKLTYVCVQFLERDLTLFAWSEIFWHPVRYPSGYPTRLFKSPQSKGGRTPPHSSGEAGYDSRLPSRVATGPNLQNRRHNLILVVTIPTNPRNYNPHSLFSGSHRLEISKHHQGRSIRAATTVYKCGRVQNKELGCVNVCVAGVGKCVTGRAWRTRENS